MAALLLDVFGDRVAQPRLCAGRRLPQAMSSGTVCFTWWYASARNARYWARVTRPARQSPMTGTAKSCARAPAVACCSASKNGIDVLRLAFVKVIECARVAREDRLAARAAVGGGKAVAGVNGVSARTQAAMRA